MKILAIGAHFDDVELNCAGTLLRAKNAGAEIHLVVCTRGERGGKYKERKAEQEKVNKAMGYKTVEYFSLRDTSLMHGQILIDSIDYMVRKIKPTHVVTHYEEDFHQDHAAVSKSVKSVNRYNLFSTITFPSQDSKQPFPANLYVDISDFFFEKMSVLKNYKSQLHRPWFSEETIRSRDLGIGKASYTERYVARYIFI